MMRLLDAIRVAILRRTMKVSSFRKIFTTRSYRLFAYFVLSLTFNTYVSIHAPLWTLLFGPLLFGVPHLLSSIRYVPRLAGICPAGFLSKRVYLVVGFFFVLMATLRIWTTNHTVTLMNRYPNALEMLGLALSLAIIGLLSKRRGRRALPAAALLAALFFASSKFPLQALGALVLIHNFVGFFFWIQRSESRRDKSCAYACLALFSAATGLILWGAFDFWIAHRNGGILGGSLNDLAIGSSIFPNHSPQAWLLWSRAVSAYALGQGMHYFVWLKAIPEQELPYEHAISFVQSARLLTEDMGRKLLWLSGTAAAALILFALFVNFPDARLLYLSGSAFHGYFELAGLPFVEAISSRVGS